MSTPTEDPSNSLKKLPLGKLIYGIVMVALVVVLAISGIMFLRERMAAQPTPTETTVWSRPPRPTWPPTEPTSTEPMPTEPMPTEPTPTEPIIPGPTEPTPTEPVIPKPTEPTPTEPTEPVPTDPPVEITEPDIRLNIHKEPVSLLSQAARDYLAAKKVDDVTAFLSRYWETESRSDLGRPVELSYTVYAMPKGVQVDSVVVRLFATNGSGRYMEYPLDGGKQAVLIYNLLSGTQYRYNMMFTLSDGTKLTQSGTFKTAAGPRLMNIDGLVNVRDLGGWVTTDGKIVRQGILYRGCEMDGLVKKEFKLTQQGLEQMKALGIKTDLDLRHMGQDALGSGVKHLYYDATQYEHIFTPAGKEAVRKLFADLASPANYPAYLHCTYGADRTGTMCYLLLGLLGVSDADLKRDYEMTALYYGYVSPEQMDAFVAKIAALPGENTRQRVECFLESAGVTQSQMKRIRQIFLG